MKLRAKRTALLIVATLATQAAFANSTLALTLMQGQARKAEVAASQQSTLQVDFPRGHWRFGYLEGTELSASTVTEALDAQRPDFSSPFNLKYINKYVVFPLSDAQPYLFGCKLDLEPAVKNKLRCATSKSLPVKNPNKWTLEEMARHRTNNSQTIVTGFSRNPHTGRFLLYYATPDLPEDGPPNH